MARGVICNCTIRLADCGNGCANNGYSGSLDCGRRGDDIVVITGHFKERRRYQGIFKKQA